MRPGYTAIFLLISLVFSFWLAGDVQAQGLGSLLTQGSSQSEPEGEDAMSEIIRRATEGGVGVVVINNDGNIVTGSNTITAEEAPNPGQSSALMQAQDSVVQFRTTLIERTLDLPNAWNEVLYILRATSPDGTIWAYFKVLYLSLLLFGIGMVVEAQIYGKRLVKRFVVARIMANPRGYSEKMPFLVFRFFMGVIGILVSMAVAYALGFTIWGPLEDPALQFTASVVNMAYFFSRLVAVTWRMILSPYLPQYRIPLLDTRDARHLHYWLVLVGTFDIWRLLFILWLRELGLNYDIAAFFGATAGAIVVVLNILMVLVNRTAISNAILRKQPREKVSWMQRTLSGLWAPAVILYMIYAWGQVTYDLVLGEPPAVPLIAGAYAILLSIIVVFGVINFAIERSFARARALRDLNEAKQELKDEGADDPELAAELEAREKFYRPNQLNSFEALARRVAGILAFVAGIYAFFYIWDNESAKMVESATSRMLDVIVILFIGYIIYQAFRIWIDNKIAEEQGDDDEGELGDEGAGSSASRLATLLPLFRNFILIVLVASIFLIVLMELGVNVGPLFAGAGVVGVAVGFGSQALVRDIFSGGFFLFDDAFRKGEYLDVGGVKGTVEKISVRSFQLRHHLGALHTIPFGEIQVMTNYSRDWVIMKLPLRVTYDTDVEKVRKLIKKLGVELLDDPVIGDNFIQPLKSQGVIQMEDSAMIIRVKFMTKPGDQWLVRKKVYEEIRILFEREGIKFAHREVTVRLADGKTEELTEEDRKAITAAAQASIEEDLMEGGVEDGDDR